MILGGWNVGLGVHVHERFTRDGQCVSGRWLLGIVFKVPTTGKGLAWVGCRCGYLWGFYFLRLFLLLKIVGLLCVLAGDARGPNVACFGT